MPRTGQTLLRYTAEPDNWLRSFSATLLGKSQQMLLLHYGLVIQQKLHPEDSFVFRSTGYGGCVVHVGAAER